jgi:hypothetical protein
VGEDDPTYVAQIVRGLEQLGMTARHMSAFSLRLAPRPPDLTVLLGSAVKDGGAEVVDQLGKNRGPFAVVMGPGGLAARLEARQRGLFVLPRAERGEEMATALAELMGEIEAGTASPAGPMSTPSQPPVAVDGLDWDEDDQAETVNKPEPVAWRKTPAPPLRPPPLPRPPGERTTLPGAASSPGMLTFDEVTAPGGAPSPELQRAMARPATREPDVSENDRKTVRAPSGEGDSERSSERTLNDETVARKLAEAMNEAPSLEARLPADPDVTAPQAALFEPASSADMTAPHAAVTEASAPPILPADDAGSSAEPSPSWGASAPPAPSTPATMVMEGVSPPGPPPSAPIPAYAPPPPPRQPPRPEKKSGALGLVLGVLAVLGVLGAGGAIGVWALYFRVSTTESEAVAAGADPALPAEPPLTAPHIAAAVPAEEAPLEAAPVEAAPVEAAPVEAAPLEAAPVAAAPVAAAPVEAAPIPPPTEALTPEQARAQSDVAVDQALAHERAGRLAEAAAAFAQAAAVHDLNPHAHAGLARVAMATGNAQEAVGHAERAARLRRRRPEYQVLLGDARRAAGDTAGARRAYEQALEIDPSDRDARERLGGAAPAPAPEGE